MAANMINEQPDAGTEYVVIDYTATYTGDAADGQSAMFVGVEYVTGSGTTVDPLDKLVVATRPDREDQAADSSARQRAVRARRSRVMTRPPASMVASRV